MTTELRYGPRYDSLVVDCDDGQYLVAKAEANTNKPFFIPAQLVKTYKDARLYADAVGSYCGELHKSSIR